MPDTDQPTLLCTQAQFEDGGFADLVSAYPANGLTDALAEATRACEDQADRRLTTFTVTETTRAQGIDVDELGGYQGLPVSIQSSLGYSEALSLGVTNLVRHTWLAQYAPRYPDLWTTSPNMTITLIRSYGGTQVATAGQILDGPDDTGHVWFQLGTFIPQGSRIRVTYSGGYTTSPAGLTRAAKFFTASIIVRELDPGSTDHNPDQLWNDGMRFLLPFGREGSPVHVWAQRARVG